MARARLRNGRDRLPRFCPIAWAFSSARRPTHTRAETTLFSWARCFATTSIPTVNRCYFGVADTEKWWFDPHMIDWIVGILMAIGGVIADLIHCARQSQFRTRSGRDRNHRAGGDHRAHRFFAQDLAPLTSKVSLKMKRAGFLPPFSKSERTELHAEAIFEDQVDLLDILIDRVLHVIVVVNPDLPANRVEVACSGIRSRSRPCPKASP